MKKGLSLVTTMCCAVLIVMIGFLGYKLYFEPYQESWECIESNYPKYFSIELNRTQTLEEHCLEVDERIGITYDECMETFCTKWVRIKTLKEGFE